MVQRKVPDKLGIQADHVKSEKRLGNLNLKPTSCQHQDGKNRGSDMKKKMKRSRPIKLSDIESFKSSPLRKTASQPGKPPPFNAQNAAATPEKQRLIKTTGGSPNYMKATSSSEARKESSQVSSSSTPTGSDSRSVRRRNSSNSSASSNKPARTLTKPSSLKLVRTLTKSPSFKPVRSTAKKCSRVALCADINVQKVTCSSTLKDSKFPEYLMLNPGGTEAEGTSVLKVCPYTYCSLNGHHHTPLPPLKCFLKAIRRSLKAQKSATLEVLSPRRAKVSGDGTEEIRSQLLVFSDGKHAQEETGSTDLAKVPLVKEVENDFFIEIYAKNTADDTEAIEKHTEDGVGTIGVSRETNEENIGNDAAAEQDGKKQVAENQTDASPCLEIDLDENFEENNYAHSEEMWISGDFLEQQEAEDAEADCSHILAQEEGKTGGCDPESDIEGESHESMEEGDNISEATDMEWEEGQLSASEIGTETHHLVKLDEESSISVEYLPDMKKLDLPDKPEIIKSDAIVSHCTEEILVDNVLQEFFDEESASSGTLCNDSDSEIESMMQTWEILEPTEVDGDVTGDKLSSIEDAFEEPTVEEKSEEAERDLISGVTTSMGEPIDELAAGSENLQEDGVCEIDTSLAAEALNGYQDDKSLQASGELSMGVDISNSSESSSESDQEDAKVNDNQNHISTEACQLDEIAEDNSSSPGLVNENCNVKHCDNQLDCHRKDINVADSQNSCEEDKDGPNKYKTPTSTDAEEQSDLRMYNISSAGKDGGEIEKMEVEVCTESDAAETFVAANNRISAGSGSTFFHRGTNSSQENASNCNNRKWTIKYKKPIMDLEEEREFNPREPNFLPVVPDPEAEKVDLRHQIMDERKNAEEWMLDYALQQAVTKLAPARKRKVALLVEAFEKVLPIPKYEPHIRHTSAAFSHARPIQAYS